VTDGDAAGASNSDAELAVRAGYRGGGQITAQAGVERAEAVALARPLGQPEQGDERKH
jgi:hypothetical protein